MLISAAGEQYSIVKAQASRGRGKASGLGGGKERQDMAPTVVASTRQLFGGSKPQLAAHGRTAQHPLCCYCPLPPWPSACCTWAGARGSTRLRHTGHSGLLRSQGSRQAA